VRLSHSDQVRLIWRFGEEFVDCVDTRDGHPYSCRVEVAFRSVICGAIHFFEVQFDCLPDKIVDSLKPGRASRHSGRRWLGFCLLMLIAYGSTADAIHHHGNVVPRASVKAELSLGSSDSDSTANRSLAENDCTICQLQRNLHVSLLYSPVRMIAPVTQIPNESTAVASYLFTFHAPRRGRAPPRQSLT